MATKLAQMRIDEVSGVDSPANLTDGWLMRKAVTDAITAPDTDESVLSRMAAWFRKAEETQSTDSEGEIDMTQEELTAALEAQTEAIGKSVGDAVSAALAASETARAEAEATATAEAETAAAAEAAAVEPVTEPAAETVEAPAAVTVEQFGELSERVETIAKAIELLSEPLKSLVSKSATRTSIDEPATEPVEKAAPVTGGIFSELHKQAAEGGSTRGATLILGRDPERS